MSHDRYFINRTATRILDLTSHMLIGYIGNYDYYLEKKETLENAYLTPEQNASSKECVVSEIKQDWQTQKELQAKARKRENDLKKCEENITVLEQQLADTEAEMVQPEVATNVARLQELTKLQAEINDNLTALYEQWEVLAEGND